VQGRVFDPALLSIQSGVHPPLIRQYAGRTPDRCRVEYLANPKFLLVYEDDIGLLYPFINNAVGIIIVLINKYFMLHLHS
jgi:hypothetical protein